MHIIKNFEMSPAPAIEGVENEFLAHFGFRRKENREGGQRVVRASHLTLTQCVISQRPPISAGDQEKFALGNET